MHGHRYPYGGTMTLDPYANASNRTLRSDDPERYCRAQTVSLPVGSNETFVHALESGSGLLLDTAVAELLAYCDTFESAREHALNICRHLGLADRDVDVIERHVIDLAERGVLVPLSGLMGACEARAAANREAPQSIASTVIVTRDRPALAARSLNDLIDNHRRTGRDTSVVVLDDSPDSDMRQRYRHELGAVSRRAGVEVLYAGREEKRRFVDALVGPGHFPAAIIEFALFGSQEWELGDGANRNACLLHTIGEASLSVDDDTRFRIAAAPDAGGGLVISSVADPTEFQFFPDRDATLDAVAFTDEDPLVQHERLLGRHTDTCIAEFTRVAGVRMGSVSSRLLTSIQSGRGRVRATMTGIVGDCGASSRSHYLTLEGPGLDRLLSSEPGYEELQHSREVVRIAPTWTITDRRLFMTTAVGLDHTELLPPFCPVLRNADSVFGATLRRCSDDWLIGHLPWGIEHAPAGTRRFETDPCATPCRVFASDVLRQCLTAYPRGPARLDPPDRLRDLGRHLQGLASLDSADFDEFVRVARWRRLGAWIARLESALAAHPDAPSVWREEIMRCIRVAQESLLTSGIEAANSTLANGHRQGGGRIQRLVHQFGELVEHWPDVCAAVQELRERERRIAAPLS